MVRWNRNRYGAGPQPPEQAHRRGLVQCPPSPVGARRALVLDCLDRCPSLRRRPLLIDHGVREDPTLEPKRRRVDPPQADGLWRAEARPGRHGQVQERHRPASGPEEATGRSLGPAVRSGQTRGRGCRILPDRDGRRGGRWPLLRCQSPRLGGHTPSLPAIMPGQGGDENPSLGSAEAPSASPGAWPSANCRRLSAMSIKPFKRAQHRPLLERRTAWTDSY